MDAVDEELRTLRARAYGPHADIMDDPAAVRRLHELEAQRSARRSESMTSAPATPVGTEFAPGDERMPDAPADTAPNGPTDLDALFPDPPQPLDSPQNPAAAPHPDSAAETTTPHEPTGPRRYRRRTLWIAAATAAAVAAGITYASVSFTPVSASSGAPQISTLESSHSIEIPAGFIGAVEDSPTFEFYGLTLFLTNSGFSSPTTSDQACLIILSTDQIPASQDFTSESWSVDGPIYNGCSVGVFPATVEVPLTADAPAELREAFPDGIALQFVLDGDRVGVFLDSE